jgi:amino acid transporter
MTPDLQYSLPPAIRRISGAFRRFGWVSFWIQLILGVIASLALLFAVASLAGRSQNSNPGASVGLTFSSVGLVAVFAGAFWAFQYVRMGRQLRGDEKRRPKPKDAIRVLKTGLFISLGGMLLTLIGGEAMVGSLLAKALSQPQGAAVFGLPNNVSQFVQPLDIFVIQANTNILLAHFIGLVFTLWTMNSLDNA